MRRKFDQKEIKCVSGKKLLVGTLTAINSLVVTTTYFQSGNDFLWHNGVVDHQLTQSNERWEWYLLGLNSAMCGFVLVSNQFGMASHISKFLRKVCGMEIPKISKSEISPRVLALMTMGAICKGVISSSSLLSTVRDFTGEWRVSSACSGISLIGNIGATAVVLLEHTNWRGELRPCVAKAWAFIVGVLYGISQGCLYSNALFNPLLLTGVLKERPGIDSDSTGRLLLGLSAYPLAEFTICSGLVIYQKTCKVLGPKEVEVKRTRPSLCRLRYENVRGGVASVFRTLGLLAAVFGFFYFLSDKNLPLTSIITALCSLAAPGVFAVLHPFPRSPQGFDMFTSAANYRPLLPINESDDDSDDEQYLVPHLQ